jgi:hypothetical protein
MSSIVSPFGPWSRAILMPDIVFHVFILIIDAFLERRDRQMFELREQLKKQFKETQRAQQKEKRASDLNKRFISYSTPPYVVSTDHISLSRGPSTTQHRFAICTELGGGRRIPQPAT